MSVAPKTDDRRPAAVPTSVHAPYPGDRLWSSLRGRPWATFTHIEAGGGMVLLVATVVALVAANSRGPMPTSSCGRPTSR